jgi:hypothetical protein
MKARAVLLAAGALFGSIELQDIFRLDVWIFPLVFAALFFGFTVWYWRRDSLVSAGGLAALFVFEAVEAPGWLGTPLGTKVFCIVVSVVGIFAAITVLITRLRGVRQIGRQRST